ncbi:nicotinate-nucleotide pyrophosphorylase (carboxylating) [Phycisphaerales bacterium]|nr:nicotinate-nucleotide pyrophosphorylase (carboxylating) [Phycisphaerales bacterium]
MPVRDFNSMPLPALYETLASDGLVRRLIDLAYDEDLGAWGDVTSRACIDAGRAGSAKVVARQGGVIAGLALLPDLKSRFAPSCECVGRIQDGLPADAGTTLAELRGPMRELLALERTLLNLVGRLSGIATLTAAYVRELPPGSRARLYDTRKTTPGLRVLEKYAVRCGGGRCHRMGLHDALLIKDNHLAAVGPGELASFVRSAAERARRENDLAFVEVEVDSLAQLDELVVLPRGVVDIVLLDNMTTALLREAAHRRDARAAWLELEASGGVRLETVAEIASTGVDRISAGALTHQAVSLDVALDL